jgi:hypothetical protein
MQRRPGATYGTKARRIVRPSSQAAEPSVASVTGSKTDVKSDDEDDEVKVRKSVQDFGLAKTQAGLDAVNNAGTTCKARTSSYKSF